MVICEEAWHEVDPDSGEIVDKTSRHVWISSRPLRWDCLHERCNLGARSRWGIEISMLVEKRQGYHYEHAFSYDWNAMKGFQSLMRLAHLLNAIAQYTKRVAKDYRTKPDLRKITQAANSIQPRNRLADRSNRRPSRPN